MEGVDAAVGDGGLDIGTVLEEEQGRESVALLDGNHEDRTVELGGKGRVGATLDERRGDALLVCPQGDLEGAQALVVQLVDALLQLGLEQVQENHVLATVLDGQTATKREILIFFIDQCCFFSFVLDKVFCARAKDLAHEARLELVKVLFVDVFKLVQDDLERGLYNNRE